MLYKKGDESFLHRETSSEDRQLIGYIAPSSFTGQRVTATQCTQVRKSRLSFATLSWAAAARIVRVPEIYASKAAPDLTLTECSLSMRHIVPPLASGASLALQADTRSFVCPTDYLILCLRLAPLC